MKTKNLKIILAVLMCCTALACGSTSKIKPATSQSTTPSTTKTSTPSLAFDLSPYDRVMVENFVDQASDKEKKDYKREKTKQAVQKASGDFATFIADEIKARGNFLEVVLAGGLIDEKTLVISGQITRLKEGNSTARLLVGFGAGSAVFDANVEFRDGFSKNLLATVVVDKNSWALGGWLAAKQTPEDFMKEAAKKIAENLYQMRPNKPPARFPSISVPASPAISN
ncbi:DUF4410 domain-containing protein [bacterium]|nr:DUF4410 domain-containing protein [bacterium]